MSGRITNIIYGREFFYKHFREKSWRRRVKNATLPTVYTIGSLIPIVWAYHFYISQDDYYIEQMRQIYRPFYPTIEDYNFNHIADRLAFDTKVKDKTKQYTTNKTEHVLKLATINPTIANLDLKLKLNQQANPNITIEEIIKYYRIRPSTLFPQSDLLRNVEIDKFFARRRRKARSDPLRGQIMVTERDPNDPTYDPFYDEGLDGNVDEFLNQTDGKLDMDDEYSSLSLQRYHPNDTNTSSIAYRSFTLPHYEEDPRVFFNTDSTAAGSSGLDIAFRNLEEGQLPSHSSTINNNSNSTGSKLNPNGEYIMETAFDPNAKVEDIIGPQKPWFTPEQEELIRKENERKKEEAIKKQQARARRAYRKNIYLLRKHMILELIMANYYLDFCEFHTNPPKNPATNQFIYNIPLKDRLISFQQHVVQHYLNLFGTFGAYDDVLVEDYDQELLLRRMTGAGTSGDLPKPDPNVARFLSSPSNLPFKRNLSPEIDSVPYYNGSYYLALSQQGDMKKAVLKEMLKLHRFIFPHQEPFWFEIRRKLKYWSLDKEINGVNWVEYQRGVSKYCKSQALRQLVEDFAVKIYNFDIIENSFNHPLWQKLYAPILPEKIWYEVTVPDAPRGLVVPPMNEHVILSLFKKFKNQLTTKVSEYKNDILENTPQVIHNIVGNTNNSTQQTQNDGNDHYNKYKIKYFDYFGNQHEISANGNKTFVKTAQQIREELDDCGQLYWILGGGFFAHTLKKFGVLKTKQQKQQKQRNKKNNKKTIDDQDNTNGNNNHVNTITTSSLRINTAALLDDNEDKKYITPLQHHAVLNITDQPYIEQLHKTPETYITFSRQSTVSNGMNNNMNNINNKNNNSNPSQQTEHAVPIMEYTTFYVPALRPAPLLFDAVGQYPHLPPTILQQQNQQNQQNQQQSQNSKQNQTNKTQNNTQQHQQHNNINNTINNQQQHAQQQEKKNFALETFKLLNTHPRYSIIQSYTPFRAGLATSYTVQHRLGFKIYPRYHLDVHKEEEGCAPVGPWVHNARLGIGGAMKHDVGYDAEALNDCYRTMDQRSVDRIIEKQRNVVVAQQEINHPNSRYGNDTTFGFYDFHTDMEMYNATPTDEDNIYFKYLMKKSVENYKWQQRNNKNSIANPNYAHYFYHGEHGIDKDNGMVIGPVSANSNSNNNTNEQQQQQQQQQIKNKSSSSPSSSSSSLPPSLPFPDNFEQSCEDYPSLIHLTYPKAIPWKVLNKAIYNKQHHENFTVNFNVDVKQNDETYQYLINEYHTVPHPAVLPGAQANGFANSFTDVEQSSSTVFKNANNDDNNYNNSNDNSIFKKITHFWRLLFGPQLEDKVHTSLPYPTLPSIFNYLYQKIIKSNNDYDNDTFQNTNNNDKIILLQNNTFTSRQIKFVSDTARLAWDLHYSGFDDDVGGGTMINKQFYITPTNTSFHFFNFLSTRQQLRLLSYNNTILLNKMNNIIRLNDIIKQHYYQHYGSPLYHVIQKELSDYLISIEKIIENEENNNENKNTNNTNNINNTTPPTLEHLRQFAIKKTTKQQISNIHSKLITNDDLPLFLKNRMTQTTQTTSNTTSSDSDNNEDNDLYYNKYIEKLYNYKENHKLKLLLKIKLYLLSLTMKYNIIFPFLPHTIISTHIQQYNQQYSSRIYSSDVLYEDIKYKPVLLSIKRIYRDIYINYNKSQLYNPIKLNINNLPYIYNIHHDDDNDIDQDNDQDIENNKSINNNNNIQKIQDNIKNNNRKKKNTNDINNILSDINDNNDNDNIEKEKQNEINKLIKQNEKQYNNNIQINKDNNDIYIIKYPLIKDDLYYILRKRFYLPLENKYKKEYIQINIDYNNFIQNNNTNKNNSLSLSSLNQQKELLLNNLKNKYPLKRMSSLFFIEDVIEYQDILNQKLIKRLYYNNNNNQNNSLNNLNNNIHHNNIYTPHIAERLVTSRYIPIINENDFFHEQLQKEEEKQQQLLLLLGGSNSNNGMNSKSLNGMQPIAGLKF